MLHVVQATRFGKHAAKTKSPHEFVRMKVVNFVPSITVRHTFRAIQWLLVRHRERQKRDHSKKIVAITFQLGALQRNKFKEIRVYYGSGFQVSLGMLLFLENHPKIALNQYWHVAVVCHVYYVLYTCTLLKVVSYYDFQECSVHVSDGFPKKSLDGGWGELYPSLIWIF